MIRFVAFLLPLLLVLAPPQVARASEPTPMVRKYQSGQEHFHAKRFTEALPLFQEVARSLDSPNAHLYVARCLGEMGRRVEAYRAYQRAMHVADKRAASEPRFGQTAAEARRELTSLKALVGRLVVTVHEPPEGLLLEVNGARAKASQESIVAPGIVRVVASTGDDVLLRTTTHVAAGDRQIFPLQLPSPTSPQPAAPTSRRAEAGWTGDGTIRKTGYGVVGLGLAGWGMMAVFGVMANQRYNELDEQCGGKRCSDPNLSGQIDEGRTFDTLANVGLGVGLVGTVGGSLMILLGGQADSPLMVTGSLSRHTVGLRGSF